MNKEERIKAAEAYVSQKHPDCNGNKPLQLLMQQKLKLAFIKGAEAEAESKWVSVDDRLPKNFEQVLVWTTVCTTASYAYYAQNDWLYFTNSENFWLKTQPHIKVLFWQPLPSPPLNQQ